MASLTIGASSRASENTARIVSVSAFFAEILETYGAAPVFEYVIAAVGRVLSKVTWLASVTAVTCTHGCPTMSSKSIVKVTRPSVSPETMS